MRFTWKKALDNWVEYKKLCNTASGWTGVREPSQEEFGSEGVRTHLCPKAPARSKALCASGAASDPFPPVVIGVVPPCLQGWVAVGHPALKHSSASISPKGAVLPFAHQ